MSALSTHAYVGTMACGCNVAVAVDEPDHPKSTAASVAEMIGNGYTISRVPLEDLRTGALKLSGCIHKPVPA